ncbi:MULTISPECIES: hypothetical protein [Thiorhodovibrio]|uniref:hypothetical protein n=1 Tax=Thiorhodovibrio TaxID=61593 RepID=UPI00191477AD|nr:MULTISPECIES: hypothetical protein [Thiorhodovibrio]WPL11238.1 hypothetical protein Thiosp_00970 [Thiorhodovibrio litoralis]
MKVSTPVSRHTLHQVQPPPLGAAQEPPPPAIRRAGGGLRFLGALLLFSTLSLLSCQSLFVF